MKSTRISFTALAFTTAFTSAFMIKSNAENGRMEIQYYWYDPSLVFKTKASITDEIIATGCDGFMDVCEKAYLPDQLKNQNDPAEGIREDQINRPYILIFAN